MGSVPKTKKKNIPKSIHEMSKEMLQETLRKKKECNAKALVTVEKLCEKNVDEEWFLDNLQFINQCHFDDAVVERAITKICGYPLCDKKLDKVTPQQYHISTRYNKVFDITERKNFCSSICYKSATYVKKQLFTSPLWFRDQEVIPKYKILKEIKSSLGEEIVFYNKIEVEPDVKKTNSVDETVDEDESINEMEEKYGNLKLEDSESDGSLTFEESKSDRSLKDSEEGDKTENKTKKTCDNTIVENKISEKINIVERRKNEDVRECSIDSPVTKEKESKVEKVEKIKTSEKIKNEPVDIVTKVEKYIFEWFSLDTLFYLYGEEKLKEMFHDKAVKIKEIINSKLSMASYDKKIDKIIKLYGLLDTDLLTRNDIKTNLKPLPDYSILKEEGKTLEIKVRAFYQGQLEIKPAENKEEKKEEETKTDSEPIYLPLVDAHAQTALRRKIVLDKLNKVLPELIRVFSTSYNLQMNEVRNLVSTFTLAAHNIVFKPREWYLVGAIIIKLMCLKDKQLDALINSKSAESQIVLILLSYQLNGDYLDDLLQRLTDSANVISKLTVINE